MNIEIQNLIIGNLLCNWKAKLIGTNFIRKNLTLENICIWGGPCTYPLVKPPLGDVLVGYLIKQLFLSNASGQDKLSYLLLWCTENVLNSTVTQKAYCMYFNKLIFYLLLLRIMDRELLQTHSI